MSMKAANQDVSLVDFLVSWSNLQNETFKKMQETLKVQSEKLGKLEDLMLEVKAKVEVIDVKMIIGAGYEKFVAPLNAYTKKNDETLKASPHHELIKTEGNVDPVVDCDGDFDPAAVGGIFCFDCKKAFVRGSGEFTRHVKETPCKPYKCHCGKLFKKKSSLTTHQSTHSTDVFKCHCGSEFKCEQYLKNHIRRSHLEEAFEGEMTAKRFCQSPPAGGATEDNEIQENDSLLDPMDLLCMHYGENDDVVVGKLNEGQVKVAPIN